jgi:hypothetical protein
MSSKIALLGYSEPAFEAMQQAKIDFIAVVPSAFTEGLAHVNIDAIAWDFGKVNEQSINIVLELQARGVDCAVPLYEETVEWAGYLNSHFRDDPRLFNRYFLFRNKAMMKRKAQLAGIRVGIFEEADDKRDVALSFKESE